MVNKVHQQTIVKLNSSFLAPLSLQVSPIRQRVDVGQTTSISCDIKHGFPVQKLLWLHNGKQIHVEKLESNFLQTTNNASIIAQKDKGISRLRHELVTSPLSSLSTNLPSMSTSISNPSSNNGETSNVISGYKTQDDKHFVENGKVSLIILGHIRKTKG